MEEDHEFVYLALEKCKATLAEAMQASRNWLTACQPAGKPADMAAAQ